MIKIHPPHQLLFPNDYLQRRQGTGDHLPGGRGEWHSGDVSHRHVDLSGCAQQVRRSDLPGRRGGGFSEDEDSCWRTAAGRCGWRPRSSWCGDIRMSISTSAAFRRRRLLKYFPRLEEIAHKTLFGTDWPGPGVPDIEKNLDDFRALAAEPKRCSSRFSARLRLAIWPR